MKLNKILPILFGFFIMGFVDVVGIATNYVQNDFQLSDTLANTLPMIVFLWFAICSIPTGIFMQKHGKKKTVCLAMILTFIAMLLPLFQYNFPTLLLAFGLLGISNTIMQVSLNPLIASIVSKGFITSILTWGQFIKAISSFLGPIIAGIALLYTGNWKLIFVVYAVITLVSIIWMAIAVPSTTENTEPATFKSIIILLKEHSILYLFIGILVIVGIDVGLNTVIPKLLIEKTGIALSEAGLGNSIYFAARTIGTLIGAILLAKIAPSRFFQINMIIALIGLIALMPVNQLLILQVLIAVIGFACSNVFSILFSYALQYRPAKNNEISALMIIGVSGGALIPPIMGIIADNSTQTNSLLVLLVGIMYLLSVSLIIRK